MALDPRYIWLPQLEAYFVDKDTTLPLSNGYILFFEDDQRTIGKQVFQLTGSPPNYSYLPLGSYDGSGAWRVPLDQDGTIDQPLYFYPYDNAGEVENYFIQIYSSGDVLQRSLEAIPNLPAGSSGNVVTTNYVANPQFAINYTPGPVSVNGMTVTGLVTQPITEIAPGGWTFERSVSSTARDIITFTQLNYALTPPSNPKFAMRYQCTSADPSDAVKDIRLKFFNVNKFASTTQYYTYGFYATLNAGTSLAVELHLIKNYGTGGSPSPQSDVLLHTFTLSNAYTNQSWAFIFGANTGISLGTNNDDYVSLALRFPNSTFDVSITDFVLPIGNVASPILPDFPDSVYFSESLAGYYPRPRTNGYDLGLPVINMPTGYVPDETCVGDIIYSLQSSRMCYLLCDGSQYEAAAYSTDGIPYGRLADFLWDNTTQSYDFGNGSAWLTTYIPTATNFMLIATNRKGSTIHASDGVPATTFTFSNVADGADYHVNGLYSGTNHFVIWNDTVGSTGGSSAASAQTSGFTVTYQTEVGLTNIRSQSVWTTVAASAIPQSSYLFFSSHSTNYYLWFDKDGGGTDPAIGGRTGIRARIKSTYTAQDNAIIVSQILSGRQITGVTTVAGASVVAGATFNIYAGAAGTTLYQPYYTINGVGTNPSPNTDLTVAIDLTGTETAAQVATKTQYAINHKFFAVPDYQGAFPRIYDPSEKVDHDAQFGFRWDYNNINPTLNTIGSLELDIFAEHYHDSEQPDIGATIAGGATFTTASQPTGNAGGYETRPVNFAVNAFIHY